MSQNYPRRVMTLIILLVVLIVTPTIHGFVIPRIPSATTISSALLAAQPDVASMRASEIRKELESYGVSTKSFLEKSELVDALNKARESGKTPKQQTATEEKAQKTTKKEKKAEAPSKEVADEKSRDERIRDEMEKAKSMKVGELRKELTSRGISTKSFFEKSEFVRAYAEAVVDGKGSSSSTAEEEEFDPSYRDVTVRKMDAKDPRFMQGTIIDVKLGS